MDVCRWGKGQAAGAKYGPFSVLSQRWREGALPRMVNENAPEQGPNTFKAMFWKQFGETPPPSKTSSSLRKKQKGEKRRKERGANAALTPLG